MSSIENKPNPDILEKAAGCVVYEIDMFRLSVKFLLENLNNVPEGQQEQFYHNLRLEGFALHTRVLHDLFYQEVKKVTDDILVKDFLVDKEWELFNNKRTPKKDFDGIIMKCNKQLAHLTYDRVTKYQNSDKGWNFTTISSMMEGTISAFLESLTNERISWFKRG